MGFRRTSTVERNRRTVLILYNEKYFDRYFKVVGLAQLPAIAVVAWVLFHFAKYIHSRWLRITARAATSLFLAIASALLMFLAFVQLSCSKHSQFYSPDRKRVMVISYIGQGALGIDYASIFIRPRWNLFAKRVFHGEAQWDFQLHKLASPEFRWLDNSHLVIGYDGEAVCEDRAYDIEITCVK